jgi:hypothetical protein
MTKHHTSTIGNASKMHFKIIVLPFSFTFLLWRSKYLTKQPKQVELDMELMLREEDEASHDLPPRGQTGGVAWPCPTPTSCSRFSTEAP